MSAGDTLGGRTIGPITQTDIVRFAGAGGDFNPLHHDDEYARAAGLPGVIAMGQLQAGLLAAWIADTVHVEHLLAYSVRFASPLAIGDLVRLTGSVSAVDSDNHTAELTVQAAVGDRVVASGRAHTRISTAALDVRSQ
ncbi:acyl dehydratase [Rhodococcoides fascians A25f]|nr:acyl dehydratase [Rhodococcus fascians A25f]